MSRARLGWLLASTAFALSIAACVIGPKQDDPAEAAPTIGGGSPETGAVADGDNASDGTDAATADTTIPKGDTGPQTDALDAPETDALDAPASDAPVSDDAAEGG